MGVKRLVIDVFKLDSFGWFGEVYLDGCSVFYKTFDNEREARAAAETYVAELLAHFRGDGE